jgi:thiamine-phosphate pyrophosphorylase
VTLHRALRLIVITDSALAAPRTIAEVVEEALSAGAPAIQLREKGASSRELMAQAERLRELTRRWNAYFFLNDRFDIALAAGADGVHLGPNDPPVTAIRSAAPEGFLIGHSTDDPAEAREAAAHGADYIGCGAVYPTSTKSDAGTAIGVEGLAAVARAVEIPVVGIGGITPEGAREIAAGSPAAGVAVIGAVMGASDPGEVVKALLAPFHERERARSQH